MKPRTKALTVSRREIILFALSTVLYMIGFGIIVWQLGWWVALGIFLILWAHNAEKKL